MKNLFWGLSLAAMALLAACSSGSGTNSEPLEISSNSSSESFNEYDSIVEEVGNLPKCVEGKDGEVYYVKEAGVAYTCRYDEDEETGEWVRKKKKSSDDDDKESSSSSEESEDVSPTSAGSTYDVVIGTLTDSRDGQTYRTVKIGDQVWMAENLNYAYTGVPIDNGIYTSDSTSWCYDNDPANCAKYGRLYTWAAAVGRAEDECGYGNTCGLGSGDIRGICPKGWHLPSHDEWEALFTAVGGSSTAGSKLKSVTGWNAYSGITNEDAFGFSALPAGYRDIIENYDREGDFANFWSSTEDDSYGAYSMYLGYNFDGAYLGNYDGKDSGSSVRCLKD
jgi:uncharacterized protein (TIGR02145 family)